MTTPATQPLRLTLEREIAAPPETVFQCWTEGEHLRRWFAPTPDHETTFAEVDPRVGGDYRIGILDRQRGRTHVVAGTFRELVPAKRLVFSWAWEEPADHPGDTLVTVELEPTSAGTKLTLVHEQLTDEDMKASHEQGWAGCLAKLASLK